MTDLLPCPFCGGPAHDQKDSAGIMCLNDGCLVRPHATSMTKARAIKIWNSRAHLPGLPQTASDPITAEDTFRATLRVIAHWAEVDLSGEWETGLRGVIRSMTDAAREALSAYPSSPVSRPNLCLPKDGDQK